MYRLTCQVGAVDEMISPDQVDRLRAGAPVGASPYQSVDFRFKVGPVFNHVAGKYLERWGSGWMDGWMNG